MYQDTLFIKNGYVIDFNTQTNGTIKKLSSPDKVAFNINREGRLTHPIKIPIRLRHFIELQSASF